AEAMFGWSAAEALGRRPDELGLVPSSDETSVATEFDRLQAGGVKGAVHRNRNRTKAGAVLEVDWYNATLGGAPGVEHAVLSFALDVTARVSAERALAAALGRAEGERARFYAMLQDAPVIISVLRGPEHVYEFVNARFCELFPAGAS
ncbi:MAG TPA: PAS domain-containing protein, partial [Polyangiaceae bacterium]|nr:PAS domain-containing protein [Polyangiaceae bacterium]